MLNLKIEKDVPMPARCVRVRKSKYSPLMAMKVGDSVVTSNRHEAQSITHFMRRNKRKAAVRAEGKAKFRVWRIK
jgi:hypothetical protein